MSSVILRGLVFSETHPFFTRNVKDDKLGKPGSQWSMPGSTPNFWTIELLDHPIWRTRQMENSPQVTNSVQEDPQLTKLKLEVENLRQLNAKLAYEVDDLRNEGPWAKHIRRLLPILTGLLAVAGFWFGIFQYIRAEDASRTARQAADSDRLMQQKNTDDRALLDLKRETAKPLWDKQLGLYIDAAEKAAIIATTTDDKIRTDAENRFWVLYWGPLAVVEDIGLTQKKAEVEEKMVQFAQLIQEKADQRDSHALKLACLNLAHAIRDSLAPAFNVEAAKLQNLRIQSQK